MAKQPRLLYELQQLDGDIDQKKERLKQVQASLLDKEAVTKAEALLEEERQSLAKLKKEQQDIEWQVEDVTTKANTLREKLYGGQVKNPKELLNMQKEVEALQIQQRELEDKVLDVMSRVEASESQLVVREGELAKQLEQWQESQGRLKAEQIELEVALSRLEEHHSQLRPKVDANYILLYDGLRADKLGKAVVKVEQGMCMGCRVSLPMSIVQRVRLGDELVQCPSCSRILV